MTSGIPKLVELLIFAAHSQPVAISNSQSMLQGERSNNVAKTNRNGPRESSCLPADRASDSLLPKTGIASHLQLEILQPKHAGIHSEKPAPSPATAFPKLGSERRLKMHLPTPRTVISRNGERPHIHWWPNQLRATSCFATFWNLSETIYACQRKSKKSPN